MTSKKAFSVLSEKTIPDNQQERIETCGWMVGFVDGEGSFLISVFRSPRARLGWQVFPEFNVSQSEKGIDLLHQLKEFFGCGHVYVHRMRKREKKNWDTLHKYCVRSRQELKERIIPFFKKYPPRSVAKKNDFDRFVSVIKLMDRNKHLTRKGMKEIIKIVRGMTHRKPFSETSAAKFLLSPETTC